MSTREIARGGLLAAAATAWLYFGGVMPQIGPAACLIAGVASAIPLLRRANIKTAGLLYLVTSVLGLLLTPRKLIAAAYVLLFGLYPIYKSFAESAKNAVLEYALKFLFCNAMLCALYFMLRAFATLPKFPDIPFVYPISLLALNLVFFIYDLGFSKLVSLYRHYRKRK